MQRLLVALNVFALRLHQAWDVEQDDLNAAAVIIEHHAGHFHLRRYAFDAHVAFENVPAIHSVQHPAFPFEEEKNHQKRKEAKFGIRCILPPPPWRTEV